MYDNIGGKIKGLAKVIFVVETIASIGLGIALMAIFESMVVIGLVTLLLGPVVAWVSSWFLYGFGELIDKACDIERNTRGGEIKSKAEAKTDDERIKKIEKMRSQGLITEEEYQQAISKDK